MTYQHLLSKIIHIRIRRDRFINEKNNNNDLIQNKL